MAANRVIGKNNTIPWYIPGELNRFKTVTWGHVLLMGRKTHESIGKPLPGRRNIIITRNRNYTSPGCEIAHSLEEAYQLCCEADKIFNIGGEELYRQGITDADTIILTILSRDYEGDVYFPHFSLEQFIKVKETKINAYPSYLIQTFQRKTEPHKNNSYWPWPLCPHFNIIHI